MIQSLLLVFALCGDDPTITSLLPPPPPPPYARYDERVLLWCQAYGLARRIDASRATLDDPRTPVPQKRRQRQDNFEDLRRLLEILRRLQNAPIWC